MLDKLVQSSAVVMFVKDTKFERWFILLTCIDVIIGLTVWNAVRDVNMLSWWEQLSRLISHIDEVISWLTSNPVGLKLNEPVNLALASFFRYHIYLWHTFVQFLYAPWLLNIVQCSLCIGFSATLALCTDLVSIFTLHIHCFEVYASRYIFR